MSTFVLVHGAFRGGWAWQRVRPLLLAGGHDVHAPSLSGCGERAASVDRVTGLDVWVEDLVGLLEVEDLTDVVLVGHSQGGVVTTALAAWAPSRIARLGYLDAAVPRPGERAVDLTPGADPATPLPPRDTLVPARPLEPGGDLDAATAAWANARLTPTPFAPSLDPMPATSTPVAAHFAFCTQTPDGYPSATTRARLDADGVPYDLVDAGHDAPLTAPDDVAALLSRWAAEGART